MLPLLLTLIASAAAATPWAAPGCVEALMDVKLAGHPRSREILAEAIARPGPAATRLRALLGTALDDDDLAVIRMPKAMRAWPQRSVESYGWAYDQLPLQHYHRAVAADGMIPEVKEPFPAEHPTRLWHRMFLDERILSSRNLVFSVDESPGNNGAGTLVHELAHSRFTRFLIKSAPLLAQVLPTNIFFIDENGVATVEHDFVQYLSERYAWNSEMAFYDVMAGSPSLGDTSEFAAILRASPRRREQAVAKAVCAAHRIPWDLCFRYNRYTVAQILRGRPWQYGR